MPEPPLLITAREGLEQEIIDKWHIADYEIVNVELADPLQLAERIVTNPPKSIAPLFLIRSEQSNFQNTTGQYVAAKKKNSDNSCTLQELSEFICIQKNPTKVNNY